MREGREFADDPARLKTLHQIRDEATAMMRRWHDELDAGAHYTAVPIRTLVQIELGAGLYLIDHLCAASTERITT